MQIDPNSIRWDAAPAAAPSGLRPLGPPSPGTALNNAGQAIRNNVAAATAPADISTATAKATGAEIDPAQTLRKEFLSQQPVKDYGTVLPIHIAALKAAPGGAGDLNVIYGLAKILDPGSVVREGELTLASGTGSLGQRLQGMFKSVYEGGSLTPKVRASLLNEMDTRGRVYNQQYNQLRDYYKELAGKHGIDPREVVGPHIAAPFQEFAKEFRKNPRVGGGKAPQGPVKIKGDEDYGLLPRGTQFIGPDGKLRSKP